MNIPYDDAMLAGGANIHLQQRSDVTEEARKLNVHLLW